MGLTPKTTSSNDTIQVSINDPALYLTQTESISSKLLAEKPLIGCLIRYESNWKEDAVGDSGRAFGILQFWQSTFSLYAEKYGLTLDYKNPEDQIYLAYRMLEDNPANIQHWSARKYCN